MNSLTSRGEDEGCCSSELFLESAFWLRMRSNATLWVGTGIGSEIGKKFGLVGLLRSVCGCSVDWVGVGEARTGNLKLDHQKLTLPLLHHSCNTNWLFFIRNYLRGVFLLVFILLQTHFERRIRAGRWNMRGNYNIIVLRTRAESRPCRTRRFYKKVLVEAKGLWISLDVTVQWNRGWMFLTVNHESKR